MLIQPFMGLNLKRKKKKKTLRELEHKMLKEYEYIGCFRAIYNMVG